MAWTDIFTGRTPDYMPRPRYVRKVGRTPGYLIGDEEEEMLGPPALSQKRRTPVQTPVITSVPYTRPPVVPPEVSAEPSVMPTVPDALPGYGAPSVDYERSGGAPAMPRLRELRAERETRAAQPEKRTWTNIGLAALEALMGGGDSVGGVLGNVIRGAGSEAIRPTYARRRDLAKADEEIGREYGMEQAAGTLEDREALRDERRARAESLRRPKDAKPVYKKQGGITYKVNPDGSATPLVGPKGEPLTPDYQRPVTIDSLADDGVSVEKLQFNPQTNKYEPITVDGQAVVSKRVERINPETGMKVSQEVANAFREKGLTEQQRHNRVTEATAREGLALRGELGRMGVTLRQEGNRIAVAGINAGNQREAASVIMRRIGSLRALAAEQGKWAGTEEEVERLGREANELETELEAMKFAPVQYDRQPETTVPTPAPVAQPKGFYRRPDRRLGAKKGDPLGLFN